MTKKGRARITTSRNAFGSSKIRTISPYETQRVVGRSRRDMSYAALMGVHPKIVKHTVYMNHIMHNPIVINTQRMRFGFVMNKDLYMHRIDILTAVMTKGKCMLPTHKSYEGQFNTTAQMRRIEEEYL